MNITKTTQSTTAAGPNDTPELTVYFDGSCPLCTSEIGFYQRCAGAEKLAFVDVSQPSTAAIAPDLDRETAMARFHVRDRQGKLVSGGKAFAELWATLPGIRPFGRLARLWPLSSVLEWAYRAFLPARPFLQRLAARRR